MTWDSALAGGGIALIGKIVYDWLANKGKPVEGTSSGDMRVDFWMAEFQEVKDKIQVLREMVTAGDVDRASIERIVENVQHTVDRIEQKINSRRK